ncbi:hypothetical protein QWZ10_01280 [Paracoccus cavernae]|uniref:Uncharacterized protein n=1 Tax=Paracoccus cavernae TaxID=1571207 RepID=A0ABT8D331_9RHOB|nr:hypothetical protein [Paracoccus cavernae]
MSRQLIANYTFADYATFRAAFDRDSEDRGRNGMTLLQLWRENPTSAWALYQISDAKAAQDYLSGAAGVFNAQAGVSAVRSHLVETA